MGKNFALRKKRVRSCSLLEMRDFVGGNLGAGVGGPAREMQLEHRERESAAKPEPVAESGAGWRQQDSRLVSAEELEGQVLRLRVAGKLGSRACGLAKVRLACVGCLSAGLEPLVGLVRGGARLDARLLSKLLEVLNLLRVGEPVVAGGRHELEHAVPVEESAKRGVSGPQGGADVGEEARECLGWRLGLKRVDSLERLDVVQLVVLLLV